MFDFSNRTFIRTTKLYVLAILQVENEGRSEGGRRIQPGMAPCSMKCEESISNSSSSAARTRPNFDSTRIGREVLMSFGIPLTFAEVMMLRTISTDST